MTSVGNQDAPIPGPAAMLVLSGTARLAAGEDWVDVTAHQLFAIPPRRHSLHAVTDTVVLLSVALPGRWQGERAGPVPGGGAGATGVRGASGGGFYESALGFDELRHEGAGLAIMRRDDVEVHLWVADGSAPGAERYLAGSPSCRLEVTGVDDLYHHCQGLGVVHPDAPLQDQWWGTREFGVLDPDGNLISLYERRPASP